MSRLFETTCQVKSSQVKSSQVKSRQDSWPDKSGWRGGGEAIEDVLSECAPHPAHKPYLTHACAPVRVRHRCFAPERGAAERGVAATARRRGYAAGGNSSEAGRALGERKWVTAATWKVSTTHNGKMQHEHRAGSARHEGPVLPSGEREPGTQLRAGL